MTEDYILSVFNTTAGFEESHLSDLLHRLISPLSPAYHPQFDSPNELLEAYLETEWTEVFDLSLLESGDISCRSFRAPVMGITNFLHITQIPQEAKFKLIARDPMNKQCDCELFAYGVDPAHQVMKYTSVMVGESSCEIDGDVIWSITPGPLRPPRKLAPHGLHGTTVSRDEIHKLGMSWAYIVKDAK